MKYLIVQPYSNDTPTGDPIAVLFPDCNGVSHRDVASLHRVGHRVVVSAGFCSIRPTCKGACSRDGCFTVEVWGVSESLHGMESRPEDANIISKLLLDKKDQT
jgi:hypothetical protein